MHFPFLVRPIKNSPADSTLPPQEQCLAAKLFRLIVALRPRRSYLMSRLISYWKWQIVPKAVVILFIIVDVDVAADAAYKIKFVTFRRGSKFKRYDINSIVLNGLDSFEAMGDRKLYPDLNVYLVTYFFLILGILRIFPLEMRPKSIFVNSLIR